MKLKNKKASESLVSTKLIVLILVVLVVLTIIIFATRAGTLSWIKNLPGFKEPVDKEIDLTVMTPDQLKNMGYNCGSDSLMVGLIGSKATGNFAYQMVYDVRYLYLFDLKDQKILTRTELKVDVDDPKDLKIESTSGTNILVGNIIERRLTLTADIKNKASDSFKELVENKKLITPDQLKRLDFSYTVGGSLICKNLSDVAKESISPVSENKFLEISDWGYTFFTILNGQDIMKIKLAPYVFPNYASIALSPIKSKKYISLDKYDLSNLVHRFSEVGRIYPDGYIWLSKDISNSFTLDPSVIFSKEFIRLSIWGDKIYKTNIKGDYATLSKLLE